MKFTITYIFTIFCFLLSCNQKDKEIPKDEKEIEISKDDHSEEVITNDTSIINNNSLTLNTHADLKNLNLEIGSHIITNSYYNFGDGGGGEYIIKYSAPIEYNKGGADNNVVVETKNGFAVLSNWRNIKAFGVIGDGKNDDSKGIQSCIDFSGDFSEILFPTTKSFYKVTQSLIIKNGQTLQGTSKSGCTIKADMAEALIILGDGGKTKIRDITFRYLNLVNDGGTVIYSRHSSNWAIYNCRITARSGGYGIDSEMSQRIGIYSSFIGTKGGYAISLMDNSNVFSFNTCQITGGKGGGVAKIGESYNVTFNTCVFETTKKGIEVASEGGNCTNFSLTNCSFEECGEPLKLGLKYTVVGANISNNFFSNRGKSKFIKENCIQIGRVKGVSIYSNTFSLSDNESAFNFIYNTKAHGFMKNSELKNNIYKKVKKKYSFSNFKSEGHHFYLIDNKLDFKNIETKQYISPTIMDSEGLQQVIIEPKSNFGGRIEKIEIIEATGSLNGVIKIGSNTKKFYNLNLQTKKLTFKNDYIDITDEMLVKWIKSDDNFILTYKTGTSQNSFKIRVTYKY